MTAKEKRSAAQKRAALKKQIIWVVAIALAIIAVAAVFFGIRAYRYNRQDHAANLTSDERVQMNYTLTVFGRNNNQVGTKEVVVLDVIQKQVGGDTQITFQVYRYTSESDLNDAMKMTVEEIANDSRFEYVGNGSVTMVDDKVAGMSNMKTSYVK